MCENSLIILVGKSETLRNGDVFYPFRQDSNFLLLTELNIPDLILVWYKTQGLMTWILYSEPVSDKEKLWGTSRLEFDELGKISWILEVREKEKFERDISWFCSQVDEIFIRDNAVYREEIEILEKINIRITTEKIRSLDVLLKNLRIQKIPEEIECIKRAISITHQAFKKLKNEIKPGMYEYEIEAIIASVYRSYHTTESYPTIVASWKNSCTMHYMKHTRSMNENDHVLIDFGAEYKGYSSDITRIFFTWEPTARMKEVYEGVKRVKNFSQTIIPKHSSRKSHESEVREYLIEELKSLGLMPKNTSGDEAIVLSKKYLPYRSLNHHLWLDTHDIGSSDDIILPGMVLTCEPGIYIREEGIGIRLEDDILITQEGYENLSEEIPL